MSPERKEKILRILRQANATNPENWLEDEQRYGTPVLEKVLFMREVWGAVLSAKDPGWLERNIEGLRARIGRKDLYALRFLPEQPDLLAALEHVRASGVDPIALATIVRESQKQLIGWIIALLDGGHRFEDGESDNWALCGLDADGNPARTFANMQELVWEFDPEKQRSEA